MLKEESSTAKTFDGEMLIPIFFDDLLLQRKQLQKSRVKSGGALRGIKKFQLRFLSSAIPQIELSPTIKNLALSTSLR